MTDIKTTAARKAQSKADKARNALLAKKPRTQELTVVIDGEDVTLKFQAIGSKEFDALRKKNPPTVEQKAAGDTVNDDTLAPQLVAATLIEPELTPEEVKEMFESGAWSLGELAQIYSAASRVCLGIMETKG